MGSGAMMYIPSFIKTGSSIQRGGGIPGTQHGECNSLLLLFQNKESRLKLVNKKYVSSGETTPRKVLGFAV
jgi:hypothetical protein